MAYRNYLFLLLAVVTLTQVTALIQRSQVHRDQLVASTAVTDLARIAGAVQTYSVTSTASAGGVAAPLADLTWEDLGLTSLPCDSLVGSSRTTRPAARPTSGGSCVEPKPGLQFELRPDDRDGIEIVARKRSRSAVARARIQGPNRNDVAIEILQ